MIILLKYIIYYSFISKSIWQNADSYKCTQNTKLHNIANKWWQLHDILDILCQESELLDAWKETFSPRLKPMTDEDGNRPES